MLSASLLLYFLAKEKTIALLRLLRDGLIVFLSFLLWKGRYTTPVLPSLFGTSGRAKQMINKSR
jgi:hypothetical protein